MGKTSLFVFIFIVFISCVKEPEMSSKIYFEKKQMNMSELVSDYSLVRLESCEDNQILDATMIRMGENRIFVLDCFAPERPVYAFDRQGHYLGKVGASGQGPGEYIMPMGIVVDPENATLMVRDVAQNKLLFYDIHSLQFRKEIRLSFRADCMELYGKDRLIWYVGVGNANRGNDRVHIYVTDMEGHIVCSGVEHLDFPGIGPFNTLTYFHRSGGEVLFHHPFLNEVYRFHPREGVASLMYTISWERLKSPTKEFVTQHKGQIIDALSEEGYVLFYDLLENTEKILCYLGTEKERYIGVYNKKEKKGLYCNVQQIHDDLGLLCYTRPKTVYKDFFVGTVLVENLENLPQHSVIRSYVGDCIDGGNPLLLIYK